MSEVSKINGINVRKELIENGKDMLKRLLPRESEKKFVDLAQLSLIYPYDVVTVKQRGEILKNVEYYLLKNKGVIRYKNDYYYNANGDGYSQEAEWTFGLAWLAIIYEKMGNVKKARVFLEKLKKTDTKDGIPELYFSNTNKFNVNTPLGWSESLFIIALYDLQVKHKPTLKKKLISMLK